MGLAQENGVFTRSITYIPDDVWHLRPFSILEVHFSAHLF